MGFSEPNKNHPSGTFLKEWASSIVRWSLDYRKLVSINGSLLFLLCLDYQLLLLPFVLVSYSLWRRACTKSLLREAGWETTSISHNHYTQRAGRIFQLRSELKGLMPAGKQASVFTLSHPFSPGPNHADIPKCCIILFHSKSIFINLFHSFIYFHRQFGTALSKPLDTVLLHRWPHGAAVTINEMKSSEPLNASPSVQFCVSRGRHHLPSTYSLRAGKGNHFQAVFTSCMWKWYACHYLSYICSSKLSMKNYGHHYIWKRWSTCK